MQDEIMDEETYENELKEFADHIDRRKRLAVYWGVGLVISFLVFLTLATYLMALTSGYM